jgi:translation elongation factor EF-Tu-like GTPase
MENKEKDIPIGKVVHYYGKIGVAVILLEESLKAGERVRFAGNKEEFEQNVESMEIDRQKISEAHKGDEIAMKAEKKVKEGTPLYRAAK